MIPFTWVKLEAVDPSRPSADEDRDEGGGKKNPLSVIVCSAHLEAGHDWTEDCPAKRDSARCVRAAVGLLQRRFGERVPVFVAGDFNAQKTQLHRRLLTGEGAGIARGLTLDDAAKRARARSARRRRSKRSDQRGLDARRRRFQRRASSRNKRELLLRLRPAGGRRRVPPLPATTTPPATTRDVSRKLSPRSLSTASAAGTWWTSSTRSPRTTPARVSTRWTRACAPADTEAQPGTAGAAPTGRA